MNLLTTFNDVISYLGYLCLALLVLLVMITVHELGHYMVGKAFHFGIEEFAIGFGPKLYSKKKKNGEVFSIRLFPLGGFCSFKGEDGVDKDGNPYDKEKDGDVFTSKKPYQRILVLIAGALMNYLLAIVIIMATFGIYGQSFYKVTILSDETPSQELRIDDVILSVEGKRIYLVSDFMKAMEGKEKGEKITVTVIRNDVEQDISVTLCADANFKNIEDTSMIVEVLGLSQLESTQVSLGFFSTLSRSFVYSGRIATTIFDVFHQLFTGKIGFDSMGGTITTIAITTKAIQAGGLYSLLSIASFIGVNLALFNLLPIPALDGSRAVFCLIEWIIGKPVNRKAEAVIHAIGFVLILAFAVFVDVRQLF